MSTNLSNVQLLAKTDLAAASAFTGLAILLEADETATPAELAAVDRAFEQALLSTGVAIVVMSPQLAILDQAERSAVSAELVVPIAFCENPEVNRGAADATATPARSPANKSVRALLEAGIIALLPHFRFPPQAAGRPEFGAGFIAYYMLAQRKHIIRAAS